ncbi:MAG: MBL fold metallo-hydrolase [Chthoniobacteraceae bacterium]
MKLPTISTLLAITLCSCSTYHPLKDDALYPTPLHATSGRGVTVTFLGNTTILISDGTTRLLVDGFFSRPGAFKTLFGRIGPDEKIIGKQLCLAGITKLDALLIGHSHHDHALDAPEVTRRTHAVAMGSTSYRFIHEGAGLDDRSLIVVPSTGAQRRFGKFTVTFRPSKHVSSHWRSQEKVEGSIDSAVRPPTRYSDYNHGDVFALHIAHPDGTLAITTTAGAKKGQFKGLKADVVLLGVGLLAKEPAATQDDYWRESVSALRPHTVIPVHWDAFTRKLDAGLAPPPFTIIDDVNGAMTIVKNKGKTEGRTVRVMDLRDSFRLRNGVMQ